MKKEQVSVFRFILFFTILILVKAISSTRNTCCLNSKNKVVVVLAVEERHEVEKLIEDGNQICANTKLGD